MKTIRFDFYVLDGLMPDLVVAVAGLAYTRQLVRNGVGKPR